MAYTVRVSREGRWWALAIPELGEDALTQARRLSEAEREARDYIAVTMDVAPSTVEVRVVLDDVGLTAEALARSEELRALRAEADDIQEQITAKSAALAKELTAKRLPVRDIAALIGISHQRVSQLHFGLNTIRWAGG
ncbi:hypothetical protein ACQPZ2_01745 [Nocardia pseudovaccinii]|uniref:hypothetical protein n=1 Tax=Nocardia pseudovaccinii TaxID=189540 RepID=UPI003D8D5730